MFPLGVPMFLLLPRLPSSLYRDISEHWVWPERASNASRLLVDTLPKLGLPFTFVQVRGLCFPVLLWLVWDPQLLFRTWGEAFKCFCWCGISAHERRWCWLSHWIVVFFFGLPFQSHICSQGAGCSVYPANMLSKLIDSSVFQTLHIHPESLKRIFYATPAKCYLGLKLLSWDEVKQSSVLSPISQQRAWAHSFFWRKFNIYRNR